MPLTVSNLAAKAGVAPDTVRYYERFGLLPKPERTPAGYRLYGESSVDRLLFIKNAKHLGLRLSEIRELLEIRDRGLCPCGHTHTLLVKRIGELDGEIAHLSTMRAELAEMIDNVDSRGEWFCSGAIFEIGG